MTAGGEEIETSSEKTSQAPELARRREHKRSTFVAGRTIGEKRERLETKRERVAAREKDKRKNRLRIMLVSAGFIALITILILLAHIFLSREPEPVTIEPEPEMISAPSIPIEDASASTDKIPSRMQAYIGMLESDLRSYGYQPIKAVLPAGGIREIDIYLDGRPGFIKTTIDRGSGVTAEDADRMIRYLEGQGIAEYEYIDVRIDGRAFWR